MESERLSRHHWQSCHWTILCWRIAIRMQIRSFLTETLPLLLKDLLLQTPLSMWSTRDGCPAHYVLVTGQFTGRWIGRGGPVTWPTRSPELTTFDFFLWNSTKDNIYQEQPATGEDI
jgi:hypothetical protein